MHAIKPGNAIYTASDKKHGDFLIEQWLRSLRMNVNPEGCEVRVLDYGLSTAQRYYLKEHGVRLVDVERNGHPAVIRFRDMAIDLANHPAAQVLTCDGGDIVFQADISHLFDVHREHFRAVSEAIPSQFGIFLTDEFFTKADQKRMRKILSENRQINAGFLIAPSALFIELCRTVESMTLRSDKFGPDQLVVNFLLHTHGWIELDRGYNFVVATADRPFTIRDGIFLFADTEEAIPVVHNAGYVSALRPIDGFGYGKGHNRLKRHMLQALRLLHMSNEFILDTHVSVAKWRRQVRAELLNQIKNLRTPGRRVQ